MFCVRYGTKYLETFNFSPENTGSNHRTYSSVVKSFARFSRSRIIPRVKRYIFFLKLFPISVALNLPKTLHISVNEKRYSKTTRFTYILIIL